MQKNTKVVATHSYGKIRKGMFGRVVSQTLSSIFTDHRTGNWVAIVTISWDGFLYDVPETVIEETSTITKLRFIAA